MSLMERFWSKVEIGDWQDCWPWVAGKDQNGYGQFFPESKTCVKAHRFAYELAVGPIPEGLTLDHVRAWGCSMRSCCNPLHLETVTVGENARRGGNSLKTHCPQKHPYDDENTRVSMVRGRLMRQCKTCTREANRRHAERLRRRAVAQAREVLS